MAEFYYVKNWWKFQGYRKRGPKWIKLYHSLLSDPEFDCLTEIQQWRLVKLWLYASEIDGRLPGDQTKIGRRLGLYHESSCRDLIAIFVDKGFISNEDIRGERGKSGTAETETETETEKYVLSLEKKVPKKAPEKSSAPSETQKTQVIPEWVPMEPWLDYVEMRKKIRKPLTEAACRLAFSKLESLRASGNDPTEVLQQSVLNSWQGLFEIHRNGSRNGKPNADEIIRENVETTKRFLADARRVDEQIRRDVSGA